MEGSIRKWINKKKDDRFKVYSFNDPYGDNGTVDEVEAFSGTAHSMGSATKTVGADDPNMETPFDAVKAKKIVVDTSEPTTKLQFVFIDKRKEAVTVNMDTTVSSLYAHFKSLSVSRQFQFENA